MSSYGLHPKSLHFTVGATPIFSRTSCYPLELLEYTKILILVYSNKSILELGAGSSGLSSLLIAATAKPSHIVITDGNPSSVQTLQFNANINRQNWNLERSDGFQGSQELPDTNIVKQSRTDVRRVPDIHVRQLVWGEDAFRQSSVLEHDGNTSAACNQQFDIIIASDW